MHHRGVVAATESAADFRVGQRGQRLCQIHRHLARAGDVAGAARREHLGNAHIVMRRHLLLDFIDADLAAAGAKQVGKKLGGAVDGHLAADKAGMRGDAGQRPLQFAHIARDAVRQEFQHLVRHRKTGALRLGLQNAEAKLVISGVNVGHHAPAKARA